MPTVIAVSGNSLVAAEISYSVQVIYSNCRLGLLTAHKFTETVASVVNS